MRIEVVQRLDQFACKDSLCPVMLGSPHEQRVKQMSRLCLVVDDEKAIRQLLKMVLAVSKCTVMEAGNASLALQLVKEHKGSINLIITDIYMPGEMNGVDLARTIRSLAPEIPVILMSGFSNLDYDAFQSGEFPVMEKPFHPSALLAEVERLTAPKELSASASC